MNKIWKKIVVIGMVGVLCLSTTGCDKTIAEQKEKIKQLEATIVEKDSEIEMLNQAINDTSVTEQRVTTSLQKVDGKIVPEFKFVEDSIVFPNKFELPGATKDAIVSQIKLGSMFSLSPSNNWAVKIDGSKLSFNHPAKVWGEMKSLLLEEGLRDSDTMKSLLQPFYTGFPATTIRYRQIFLDSDLVGMASDAAITVEEKPYHVVLGFFNRGDSAVEFLFTYEDDGTGVQYELINSLVGSCELAGTRIAFE